MGRLDQYAKEIFALETSAVTHGAAAWQPPSEIGLTEIRLDGCILIRDPALLPALPDPWPHAQGHDEIAFEAKMQRDHLDMRAQERACLRRQARQVQRMEADPKEPWDGDLPLWMLASHVPAVLRRRRTVREVGQGCHRIETGSYQSLWIAANELPLREELLPFLIARTGEPLDELARWVAGRRPSAWLERMLDSLPMSNAMFDALTNFVLKKPEDDEMAEHQRTVVRAFLRISGVDAEVRLAEDRDMLRRILIRRKLPLGADEQARIDACTDKETLVRWLEQAVDAPSAAEALR